MNSLLWWLAQNTVTVAVMIPLVLVACRLFRHRPSVQHLLWMVLLVKLLTPSIVSWPWPAEQLWGSVGSAAHSLSDAEWSATDSATALFARRAEMDGECVADHVGRSLGTFANDNPSDLGLAGTSGRFWWLSHAAHPWMRLAVPAIALVWMMGAAVHFVGQIRRIVRHAALVRRSSDAPQPLTDEIRLMASRLKMRPPVVHVARDIASPFVWCFGKLLLIWPQALSGKEDVRRSRGVIAHELSHVRRGDHFVAWLELAAGVVWWWNPLYWVIRRRLRETAEMACDALAIGTIPDHRREYAELLLELSAGFKTGTPAPVLAVSAGTPSSFERRLTMIVCDRVSGKHSWWGILAAGVLACVILPGWSIGQQKKEPPTADSIPATLQKFDDLALQLAGEINLINELPQQQGQHADTQPEDKKSTEPKSSEPKSTEPKSTEPTFPKKWKQTLQKELPAECLQNIPDDAEFSWKVCMGCHGEGTDKSEKTVGTTLKSWLKKHSASDTAPAGAAARLDQTYLSEIEKFYGPRKQKASNESGNALDIRFPHQNRIYSLTLEPEGATLSAATAADGKLFWKSLFAEKLPGRASADQWSLEHSDDGKLLTLSCVRKDGRLNYVFEAQTGKIIRQEIVSNSDSGQNANPVQNTNPSTNRKSQAAIGLQLELQAANQGIAAAWSRVGQLSASHEATSADLDVANIEVQKAKMERQAIIDRIKDATKECAAQVNLAQAEVARLKNLVASGSARPEELDQAVARLAVVMDVTRQLDELFKSNSTAETRPTPVNAKWLRDHAENQLAPPSPSRIDSTAVSTLDLADRYLRAMADLKNARSRMTRIGQASEPVSQQQKEESQIELERAEKQERFIAAFIDDALHAAQATRAAAANEFNRMEQLHKNGSVTASQFEAAKFKLEAATAHMNQLEKIAALKK